MYEKLKKKSKRYVMNHNYVRNLGCNRTQTDNPASFPSLKIFLYYTLILNVSDSI